MTHERWCRGWSAREYGRGETLKCRGFFSSVRGVNGFLVGSPIRRSMWPIAGDFFCNRRAWLDFMAESVWCVFPVNQDGFLPSPSSTSLTFHFLQLAQ